MTCPSATTSPTDRGTGRPRPRRRRRTPAPTAPAGARRSPRSTLRAPPGRHRDGSAPSSASASHGSAWPARPRGRRPGPLAPRRPSRARRRPRRSRDRGGRSPRPGRRAPAPGRRSPWRPPRPRRPVGGPAPAPASSPMRGSTSCRSRAQGGPTLGPGTGFAGPAVRPCLPKTREQPDEVVDETRRATSSRAAVTRGDSPTPPTRVSTTCAAPNGPGTTASTSGAGSPCVPAAVTRAAESSRSTHARSVRG